MSIQIPPNGTRPASLDDRRDVAREPGEPPEARYGPGIIDDLASGLTTAERLAGQRLQGESFAGGSSVKSAFDVLIDAASAFQTERLFDHYSATPEGRALLEREGDFLGRGDSAAVPILSAEGRQRFQRLFVARVQFIRGEGGRELFDEFTPDRAATEGQARTDHDALIDSVLGEIQSEGVMFAAGRPREALDPSLAYLIASGLVESYGSNPGLLRRIRSDINDGWFVAGPGVSLENDFAGVYRVEVQSHVERLYEGREKRITFDLDDLLRSYSDPNDREDLIAHEAAHALDAYNRSTTDGVPTYFLRSEEAILVEERERLVGIFEAGGRTEAASSGLGTYAFTNPKEFLAEILEIFLSSDDGPNTILAASPRLYDMLRVFTGRTDLPPATRGSIA